MGEGSSCGLDMLNVFFHIGNRLRVFEIGRQNIAFHLHDLLVTLQTGQL